MNKWYDEPQEDLPPSKSELKREMLGLQKLGEKIVKLSAGQFTLIPLEGVLQEAIETARKIKSREGLRRQMQYIGKLLRDMDISAIEAAFVELDNGRIAAAQHFQALEKLRDELIAEGPKSIEKVIEKHPTADRQHLRQRILQANKEKKNNKPPSAARKIFGYLKDLDKLS